MRTLTEPWDNHGSITEYVIDALIDEDGTARPAFALKYRLRMAANAALAAGDEPIAVALQLAALEIQEACAEHGRNEVGRDTAPPAEGRVPFGPPRRATSTGDSRRRDTDTRGSQRRPVRGTMMLRFDVPDD